MSRTVLVAGLFVATACGGSDNGGSAGDPSPGDPGCTGTACNQYTVEVRVNSPLPSQFTAGCPSGSVAALDALVLDLYPSGACFPTVSGAGVMGSCPDVRGDRNLTVTLVFRPTGRFETLGEQSKYLEIPSTAGPIVDLSFAGETLDTSFDGDDDLISNLDEWCAGTL